MAYNETYRTEPQIAFPGMVADQSQATIVSRTAAAAVGFGVAMIRVAGHKVRAMTTGDAAADFYGITVRSQATAADSPNQYPANDTAGIMTKGPIFVTAGSAFAEGDDVYVTLADGAFTNAAGAGKVQIAGATFESAGASGDVARVQLS